VMAAGMPSMPENFSPNDQSYLARFARAARLSHLEFSRFVEKQQHIRRAWRSFFNKYDVILCPVMPTVAFPHNTSGIEEGGQFARTLMVDDQPRPYLDNLQWPGLITVANLPATAMPTGRIVDGMPTGLQIAGPYLEDRTTIRFAQLVEREFGGFVRPPMFRD
jgi:amidase